MTSQTKTTNNISPCQHAKIVASAAQTHLGGKRTQQDYGFSVTSDNWSMAGVFDGHGNDGFSNAAAAAAEAFVSRPEFYDELLSDVKKTAETLFDAMQLSNFELVKQCLNEKSLSFEVRDKHIYCKNPLHLRGGTTATMVFVDQTGLVTTLNVGDSDAWMFSEEKATKLSATHRPETPEEYNRLMSLGTKCLYDCHPSMKSRGVSDVIPQKDIHTGNLNPYYVCNVDLHPATIVLVIDENGRGHKLAMTRAVGDENMRKGGVISTPAVSQFRLTTRTVIKIASDGYWDAIKSSDELAKTNEAVSRVGFDANALCSDWFQKTKAISDKEFGGVGDNMWGYIMTVELN